MRSLLFAWVTALGPLALAHADGRPGSIAFSDGSTLTGGIYLTPGKNLRVYVTESTAVSLSLDQVKEMRVKVEKEAMEHGFYFPAPGQATQAQTNDVYPVRYFSVEITLEDGKTVAGHLLTTMLYLDGDDGTHKVPLEAKMTGEDGQKIDDLIYAQDIRFDQSAPAASASLVDLSQAGFTPAKPPVFFIKPDMTPLPSSQVEGKQVWSVSTDRPDKIAFAVEAADGVHVAWPGGEAGADVVKAVQQGLVNMHDFYDSRTLLGCETEDEDVYAIVLLKRVGAMVNGDGTPVTNGMIPWCVALMHFDYDASAKKVTLLNRATLALGRAYNNSPPPAVLKQPELLRDISARTNP
jgi:hypothetical protein